jgi:hypothetical protein
MNRKVIAIALFMLLFCNGKSNGIEVRARELEKTHIELDGYTINDLARYISGQDQNLPDKFKSITAQASYRSYAARTQDGWKRYSASHLQKIRNWQKTEIEGKVSKNIFYPFGGPDILHPLTFFKDAQTIVMIGLEPAGVVPAPQFSSAKLEMQRLPAIFNLVSDVWGRNFYRTLWMVHDFGHSDYRSISSVLLFGLGLHNYEVLDGYNVALNSGGELEPAKPGQSTIGIRYVFRKPGDDTRRTVTYLGVDISDAKIPSTPGLKEFFSRVRDVSTMLKAASYLLHRPAFDGIRSTILGGSRTIMTDSSGLPFHYVNNKDWQISLYGSYYAPIPLFRARVEPDLRAYFRQNKAGALPFHYGYSVNPSHLVVATRAAGAGFQKPVFDDSDDLGDNSAGGHVSRWRPEKK